HSNACPSALEQAERRRLVSDENARGGRLQRGADGAYLAVASGGHDDLGNAPDVLEVDRHDAAVDGMADNIALGIEEMAQHVADRAGRAQTLELRARKQPLAEERRLLADVADADEGDVDAARPVQQLLEARLLPEQVPHRLVGHE